MIDNLGDRMKGYESVTKNSLMRRTPAIIRLDGRAFHTFVERAGFNRPFDQHFSKIMQHVCHYLFREVQTSVFVYSQSDEISILLKDYTELETEPWFSGNIQKIVSISASLATVSFNHYCNDEEHLHRRPMFDSRVFNLPKEEVANYFIWRQKDAIRNSINALGQSLFTQRDLQGKNQDQVKELALSRGIDWGTLPAVQQRGFAVYKTSGSFMGHQVDSLTKQDFDIPVFTENREFISQFL